MIVFWILEGSEIGILNFDTEKFGSEKGGYKSTSVLGSLFIVHNTAIYPQSVIFTPKY